MFWSILAHIRPGNDKLLRAQFHTSQFVMNIFFLNNTSPIAVTSDAATVSFDTHFPVEPNEIFIKTGPTTAILLQLQTINSSLLSSN